MMDGYIEGLLAERERLQRAGLGHRVAQVDAELVRVGYESAKPKKKTARRKKTAERADEVPPEQAVPERPQRRPSR
jgi:hypothetical protein